MKTIKLNIPTAHHEVEFERISSKNFRACFGSYDGFGINKKEAFNDLVNNMPCGEVMVDHLKRHVFPNGFTNWHETHYFVSCHINQTEEINDTLAARRRAHQGTGGLWELAKELTDEFENLHKGRAWDGEWMDELEAWLEFKENELKGA
jgi:hypothetical protein